MMKMFLQVMLLLTLTTATNAKLRVPAADSTLAEDAIFWSRHLMSMNLANDHKPEQEITSFGQITEEDIPKLQKAWGDALVSISKTYDEKGLAAAKELAQSVLDSAYCYDLGIPVLFKPTLTSGKQTFRNTQEGALAYFVGDNPDYPDDTGFALKGWEKVESYPASVVLLGNTAYSQGNVHITNKSGDVTIVDKTWGYLKEDDGNICIMLHHSSLPYSPS
jgi:hypothetical protein